MSMQERGTCCWLFPEIVGVQLDVANLAAHGDGLQNIVEANCNLTC